MNFFSEMNTNNRVKERIERDRLDKREEQEIEKGV